MRAQEPLQPIDAMALGERVLELLDAGAFSTTYKYALLLALVDLCMEKPAPLPSAPLLLMPREIAEKVIGYYWGHTVHYHQGQLRQSNQGQAEIVKLISEFKSYAAGDPSISVTQARLRNPAAWSKTLEKIEWKLIEMPLPRLQRVGDRHEQFLYRVGWDEGVRYRDVRAYHRGEESAPDFRIELHPGVAEGLVRLGPLIKPLVRRQWTHMVAGLNRLEVSRLEDFLFGESRVPLTQAKDLLTELQNSRCFFCDRRLKSAAEVDHFIPWSRYCNNAIENLVLADRSCNHDKRDYLASTEHLDAWIRRMDPGSRSLSLLEDFSRQARWEYWPDRSRNVASAIYLGLPDGYSLWRARGEFVPAARDEVRVILGA